MCDSVLLMVTNEGHKRAGQIAKGINRFATPTIIIVFKHRYMTKTIIEQQIVELRAELRSAFDASERTRSRSSWNALEPSLQSSLPSWTGACMRSRPQEGRLPERYISAVRCSQSGEVLRLPHAASCDERGNGRSL